MNKRQEGVHEFMHHQNARIFAAWGDLYGFEYEGEWWVRHIPDHHAANDILNELSAMKAPDQLSCEPERWRVLDEGDW